MTNKILAFRKCWKTLKKLFKKNLENFKKFIVIMQSILNKISSNIELVKQILIKFYRIN